MSDPEDYAYDAGYDEYMEQLESTFNKELALELSSKAQHLLTPLLEGGFNFSLPRLAIISALTQSAHSTIEAESMGALEGTLQGLVPPTDSDFWTAGERPDGFIHTLRRMEEPGLVELIWSTGGKRPLLIGAKLTSFGMAYGHYWEMIPLEDFMEFLSLDGEWPPKEEAEFDLRPTGLFSGFETDTSQADLDAALVGSSSKQLFARRQTVSFNRAYEAIVNHNALVCYQFLPENTRRNLTRRLLTNLAMSGDLLDLAMETIEHTNGWPNRFKKLKSLTQRLEVTQEEWNDSVNDYVVRVAWLLIKKTTDEQVINPILRPNPRGMTYGGKASYQGFSRAGENRSKKS